MARSEEETHEAPISLPNDLEFRAVFDAVPDGIAIVDANGRIREVNPQFESIFGYDRGELLDTAVELLVPAAARDSHRTHRSLYAQGPYARPMGAGLALVGSRKGGSLFPVEISLSPLSTREGEFVICTVRDVTERSRLRRFSSGTLQAAEEERLRVARELHDDTAQQLSALLIRLRLARSVEDPQVLDEKLAELREAIQACADGVRRIARGLRPPALRDVGVVAAIRSHLESVSETTNMPIDIRADPVEDVLTTEAKLVLYRIVQEAVSNVVRHARADSVTVSVSRSRTRVHVVVADDGVGFDPASQPDYPGGLGLIGMEERAASIGATVEVMSVPGRGTSVKVEIPRADEIPTQAEATTNA